MATVVASFVVLVLVVAGMAIGVMMGRKPLKGSWWYEQRDGGLGLQPVWRQSEQV